MVVFGGFNRDGLLAGTQTIAMATLLGGGQARQCSSATTARTMTMEEYKAQAVVDESSLPPHARGPLRVAWRPVPTSTSSSSNSSPPRAGHSTVGVVLSGRETLVIFGGDTAYAHLGQGGACTNDVKLLELTTTKAGGKASVDPQPQATWVSPPMWIDPAQPAPAPRTEHGAGEGSGCSPLCSLV